MNGFQRAQLQQAMNGQQKVLRDLQKQQRQMAQQMMSNLTRRRLAAQAAGQEVKTPPEQAGGVRQWLVLVSDQDPAARIEVPAGGLVLGRAVVPPGRLDNDPAVSANHAGIMRTPDGGLVISDLGSTKGTHVNGMRIVRPQPLRQGDTIQLGRSVLRVEAGASRDSTAFRPSGTAPRGGAWDVLPGGPPSPAPARPGAPSPPHSRPVPPPRDSGAATGFPNHGGLAGQVRGLQVRSEPYRQGVQRTIWSFRVERYDEAGNRVLLVPVEMRGLFFQGSIAEGEWVCVHGKRQGGTLRATRLENLSTGAVVEATGVPKRIRIASSVFGILFAIVFLAIVIFIIIQAASAPY
jgi:hypothetical protein